MSIVVSNKQKIHYQLAGEKGPWMLLHPPLIPMNAWKECEYVKHLEEDFRLVLIEPLGQGLSDAPKEYSHYHFFTYKACMTLCERSRQITHIFGMGLGAQVGFQMSKEFPRRIRSLITVGAQPYQELEEAKFLKEKLDKLRSGNISAYLQQWHSLDNLTERQEKIILQGDAEAYALGLEASINWEGLGDDLKSLTTATLLLHQKLNPDFACTRSLETYALWSLYNSSKNDI